MPMFSAFSAIGQRDFGSIRSQNADKLKSVFLRSAFGIRLRYAVV